MAIAQTPALVLGAPPRVNLMPRAEIDRRSATQLLRRWLWIVVAALAVVAVAGAGSFLMESAAQQRLLKENARTQTLISQIAALNPVSKKLSLETELSDFRASAMVADLDWAHLTEAISERLPEGVSIVGFKLEPGGMPAGDDPSVEVGVFGEVLLLSQTPQDMVGIVRGLRPVEDILAVEGWETVAEETGAGYTYLVRIAFDQTTYSGKFAKESAE